MRCPYTCIRGEDSSACYGVLGNEWEIIIDRTFISVEARQRIGDRGELTDAVGIPIRCASAPPALERVPRSSCDEWDSEAESKTLPRDHDGETGRTGILSMSESFVVLGASWHPRLVVLESFFFAWHSHCITSTSSSSQLCTCDQPAAVSPRRVATFDAFETEEPAIFVVGMDQAEKEMFVSNMCDSEDAVAQVTETGAASGKAAGTGLIAAAELVACDVVVVGAVVAEAVAAEVAASAEAAAAVEAATATEAAAIVEATAADEVAIRNKVLRRQRKRARQREARTAHDACVDCERLPDPHPVTDVSAMPPDKLAAVVKDSACQGKRLKPRCLISHLVTEKPLPKMRPQLRFQSVAKAPEAPDATMPDPVVRTGLTLGEDASQSNEGSSNLSAAQLRKPSVTIPSSFAQAPIAPVAVVGRFGGFVPGERKLTGSHPRGRVGFMLPSSTRSHPSTGVVEAALVSHRSPVPDSETSASSGHQAVSPGVWFPPMLLGAGQVDGGKSAEVGKAPGACDSERDVRPPECASPTSRARSLMLVEMRDSIHGNSEAVSEASIPA